ncbi:MAG: hypothetical protein J5I41_10805 [Saprospiraceae bacterium]|nr:hypothetical protein [Saprospiraceae bacterium]
MGLPPLLLSPVWRLPKGLLNPISRHRIGWCLLVFFWLPGPPKADAQIPDSISAATRVTDTDSVATEPVSLSRADSLLLFRFAYNRPEERRPFQQPGLDEMRRYDPLEQQEGTEYARLHNLGTAARALLPLLPSSIGFRVTASAFAPYLLPADSLYLLDARTPYSEVYYSQGRTSEDGLFRGVLGRRFGKGTDFTLEGLRIFNLGEYPRLMNHHSSLRAGLRYQIPSGKYAVFIGHGNHLLDQEESGGIRTDTLLADPLYESRLTIPVWLQQGRYQYREKDYILDHQVALAGKVDRDSLGRILLRHRLRWQDRFHKYSDPALTETDGFYGPFQTDDRGVRQYTSWSTLSNLASARFSWRGRRGRSIGLETGIEHRRHKVDNEWRSLTLHNILALASMDMGLGDLLRLRANGQADLGDQAGSWVLEGRAVLDVPRWGRLTGGVAMGRRAPDLWENELTVSGREVYRHGWTFPQQQSLFGDIHIPGWQLEAGVALHLLTDALYFREPGWPDQISGSITQQRAWVRHRLRLGPVHLHQQVSWQNSTDSRLPMPEWVTRHDLFYEGLWFRSTLRTRIGAEVRVISPWTPWGYMPVNQAFYVRDQPEGEWFPQIDGYIALERLGFRLFVELENAGQMIFGWKSAAENGATIPRVFYLVDGYPMPENWLRFGVAFGFRG